MCTPRIRAISLADLEDVLTLQTKLYRCAHIFLGNVQTFLEYPSLLVSIHCRQVPAPGDEQAQPSAADSVRNIPRQEPQR